MTTISELNEYADWARGQLDANEALTYTGLLRLLEGVHGVTASDDSIRRWLKAFQKPSRRHI